MEDNKCGGTRVGENFFYLNCNWILSTWVMMIPTKLFLHWTSRCKSEGGERGGGGEGLVMAERLSVQTAKILHEDKE